MPLLYIGKSTESTHTTLPRAARKPIDTQRLLRQALTESDASGMHNDTSPRYAVDTQMRLTPANINRLECSPGRKDRLYFDEVQRGLAVRVTQSGSKSFLCHFTARGYKRRIPLGSCSGITLAQARELTRGYLGQVARGDDPFLDRKEAKRDALTLEELISSWQALHLATRRPKYADEAVRAHGGHHRQDGLDVVKDASSARAAAGASHP
jgi:Arm DNA-binding domain